MDNDSDKNEYDRTRRMIINEYSSRASEDSVKFEVWRLLRVPHAGNMRPPQETHQFLGGFQKIMLDLAIIYRMGYCELTVLSCRALLEALAKAKLKTQENIPKGLYGLIENLPLTESDKKRAHIIRMLGDLVAHWATDVKTRRSADILEVVLT